MGLPGVDQLETCERQATGLFDAAVRELDRAASELDGIAASLGGQHPWTGGQPNVPTMPLSKL